MNLTQLEPTLFMDVRRIVLIRLRQGGFDPETNKREAILDLVLDNGRAEAVHLPAGSIGEDRLNAVCNVVNYDVHAQSKGEKALREAVSKVWEQEKKEPPRVDYSVGESKDSPTYYTFRYSNLHMCNYIAVWISGGGLECIADKDGEEYTLRITLPKTMTTKRIKQIVKEWEENYTRIFCNPGGEDALREAVKKVWEQEKKEPPRLDNETRGDEDPPVHRTFRYDTPERREYVARQATNGGLECYMGTDGKWYTLRITQPKTMTAARLTQLVEEWEKEHKQGLTNKPDVPTNTETEGYPST